MYLMPNRKFLFCYIAKEKFGMKKIEIRKEVI